MTMEATEFNPRILTKDPHGNPCFVAEGKAGDYYFQIGVTFDAAAAVPERHQRIKEALLEKAHEVARAAEGSDRFDWAAHGFRLRRVEDDTSGHSTFWERVYSLDDIWEVL